MVKYNLHIGTLEETYESEGEVKSECLPRIGESLDYEGNMYNVIAVYHFIGKDKEENLESKSFDVHVN